MIEKTHPTASASKPDSLPVGSKKNHALIMVWIIVWMASYVLFAKAATNDWFSPPSIITAGIVINTLMGLGVIVTYMKFLKELDEMQQKIQLSALALAMGVGLVGSVSYSLLIKAGQVASPDISVVIMLLGGGYMAGIVVGRSRYA